MQRLQFDLGEQISRKEYLRRKRKNSRLLRKRSKITYMLLAIFVALSIYIVVQLFIYRKYNSFKYTAGDDVSNQSIYNILFVTEGYTYNPNYTVSSILSSGEQEQNILPGCNLDTLCVTQDAYYGIKEGAVCRVERGSTEIVPLIENGIIKFVVKGNIIAYLDANEHLKIFNMETNAVLETEVNNVKQLLINDNYVFAAVYTSNERAIYRVNLDGTGKEKISGDTKPSYAIVEGQTLFFVNRADGDKIYRVNQDGSGLGKVGDITSYGTYTENGAINGSRYMFINENKLYYVNTSDENTLYSFDLQSGENTKIISASIEILQSIDNTIFYKINKEMGVYLYNYDTKFMSLVTKRRVKEFVIDPFVDIKLDI